jgi:hypothetical protein
LQQVSAEQQKKEFVQSCLLMKGVYMKGRFFRSTLDFLGGLFLVILFAACFNPLDYNLPNSDNGLISVALPGSGPAKTTLTPSGLSYELSFSGPGGQSITKTAVWGETCVVEVSPGPWTVTVTAKDGSATKAFGETAVDVIAGSRNDADVKLAVYTEVNTWAALKAAIEDSTPGDGGFADELIVVTAGFPTSGNPSDTITLSDNKTVTIAAEGDVTINRASSFGTSFLNIASGHLILGSAAYNGTLTLDGSGATVDAPIVTMTSVASFTMNSGILRNNANTVTNGGAVFVMGTFTMNGGSISGNTVTGSGSNGGGVYVAVTGTFNIGGDARIAVDNDVYLAPDKTITVTGPLSQPLKVTLHTSATDGTQVLTPGFPAGSEGKIVFADGMYSLDSDGKLVMTTAPLTTVTQFSLGGLVTAPVKGDVPNITGIDTAEYIGSVAWKNDDDSSFNGSSFLPGTVYKAVVTLSAKAGFTFAGVAADSFTHTGATSITNAADSGTVTITFPATDLEIVSLTALNGLITAPVKGNVPVTTGTGTTQYDVSTVEWKNDDNSPFSGPSFLPGTVYKAVVTLTAKAGYTFTGVAANSFTYTGATNITNAADSGIVTITFPATGLVTVTPGSLDGLITAPVKGNAPVTTGTGTTQYDVSTVEWKNNNDSSFDGLSFLPGTVYKAVVTLSAKSGFTFAGVVADSFTYTGATSITNAADSGIVTITFPETDLEIVTPGLLDGKLTAPIKGVAPDTTGTGTTQYDVSTVEWKNDDNSPFSGPSFLPGTIYKAVVSLTAKAGFTFAGVAADSFTYTGATSITNAADSGIVTITFPATDLEIVTPGSLNGKVTAPVTGVTPATTGINEAQYTGSVAWKNDDDSPFNGSSFLSDTIYKAVVTLTAKSGFTFAGVAADSFTYTDVPGVTVTNVANSGTVTIRFPDTGPIPISTQADLVKIGANAAFPRNESYIITADFSIGSLTPICSESNPFTGTLDGNSKTITITSISGGSYVGLFASIDTTGTVRNLNVTVTGTVSGTGGNVGTIAGRNYGTIENCSTNATISASSYAGGIAGDNWGTIRDCRSAGSVTTTGGVDAGGIAGANTDHVESDPQILRCFSSANVTVWNNQAGGIVGSHEKGIVENCYSSGGIITGYTNIGGIAGATDGTITNCYSTSKVTVDGYQGGGIVGSQVGGTVQNCVALNSEIIGESQYTYRIAGNKAMAGTLINNYGSTSIIGLATDEATLIERNGQDVSSGTYNTQSFWEGLGWVFSGTPTPTEPWKFDTTLQLPKLYFVP